MVIKKVINILILVSLIIITGFVLYREIPSNSKTLQEGDTSMKLKMSFNNNEVIINMYDNSASEELIALLPAEFQFRDFAGEEKIANFPKPLSFDNAPRGMVATAGKMFIYAPWGNMGIFYKDHGHIMDKSLIPLGEVESGLEYLKLQKTDFKAKLEVIKNPSLPKN